MLEPQIVGVRKIIVHPSYSSTSSSPTDNLALVRLSKAVGESYSALCLPGEDSEVSGSVVLVGWRISAVLGSLEQSLVSLTTNIVSQSDTLIYTEENTRLVRYLPLSFLMELVTIYKLCSLSVP